MGYTASPTADAGRPRLKREDAVRILVALAMLGLTACSDNQTAPTEAAEPMASATPRAVASAAPEPEWTATGPTRATIPESFRGRWDATTESCLEISDARLNVTDRALHFWEVGVEVQAVTPVGANAIRIEGTGYEEEEHFDSNNVFQLSADGSVLTMNPGPNGFARVRCLKPDFPGVETP